MSLRDTTRMDPWLTDGTSVREIPLIIWYPAESADTSPRAAYLPDVGKLPGSFRFGERWAAGQLESHARTDAPVLNASSLWPVLILSPGADTSPSYYSGYVTDLASRGYVIIAVDHAHEGRGQVLPDGRVLIPYAEQSLSANFEELGAHYEQRVMVRIADIQHVLDVLPLHREGLLAGHLDFTKIGALGHSIGGVVAAKLCRRDQRVLACASLDGLFLSQAVLPSGSGPYRQPILYAGKPFRDSSTMSGDQQRESMRRTLSEIGGGYDVIVEGASHDDFTDGAFMKPGIGGEKHQRLAALRAILSDFFDEGLNGSASSSLLHHDSTLSQNRIQIVSAPETKT